MGVICFMIRWKSKENLENRKFELILIVVLLAVIIVIMCTYLPAIYAPDVLVCDGALSDMHRRNGIPLTYEYIITDRNGNRRTFYADAASLKKVFGDVKVEEGGRYRVYYERRTKVIVRIETLDDLAVSPSSPSGRREWHRSRIGCDTGGTSIARRGMPWASDLILPLEETA